MDRVRLVQWTVNSFRVVFLRVITHSFHGLSDLFTSHSLEFDLLYGHTCLHLSLFSVHWLQQAIFSRKVMEATCSASKFRTLLFIPVLMWSTDSPYTDYEILMTLLIDELDISW